MEYKIKNKSFLITYSILFVILIHPIFAQSISNDLKLLEPLINKTWKGELKSPDGSESWVTTHEFIPLWDGTIIKYKSSTPDRDFFAEGYFYWDRTVNIIAVLIVNKNGIYQNGFVSIKDEIITIEGIISFPNTTFDYKNTLEITDDGHLIDRWFQNAFGTWRAGHVINFIPEQSDR